MTVANTQSLTPALELARADPVTIPNESAEYRAARTALLAAGDRTAASHCARR